MKHQQENVRSPLRWARVLSSLPSSPGVYWFVGQDDEVLYVGKAKNLKNRVSSYARLGQLPEKTLRLVQAARILKFAVLESELEALLTEAELIRAHQPHYNILLKDDKSPLYILLTQETFPRVLTIRKKSVAFTRKQGTIIGPLPSAYNVRQVLALARRIFPWCNEKTKTGKPCFYRHLGLCTGACEGKVTREEYAEMIGRLREFLRGKTSMVIKELKMKMREAVARQDYEHAALFRDQIRMIIEVTSPKKVLGPDMHLPQLKVVEREEMLVRLRRILSAYLSLPKKYALHRIEGYDISNTQGTRPVASMVVFTDAQADKGEYRSFNIRLGEKPNDFAMIREAIARRQNHEEWGIPDLILIDGGKGQLKSALRTMRWTLPVVSLAKEPDRLIVYNPQTKTFAIHPLADNELASTLLRQVRDEAHRFAKKHHIRRRTKALLSSVLP